MRLGHSRLAIPPVVVLTTEKVHRLDSPQTDSMLRHPPGTHILTLRTGPLFTSGLPNHTLTDGCARHIHNNLAD